MRRIYLDNNATTQIDEEVKRAAVEAMDIFGNPSSHYETGREARKLIDRARESVASFINADPEEIIFTSCATESNNSVLRSSAFDHPSGRIITTSIEHPAILSTCADLEKKGIRPVYLKAYEDGLVRTSDLEAELDENTALVSVMLANNETGAVLPIKEMAAAAHKKGIPFHTDAVQASGKMRIDVKDLGVDYLSLSGHKMYAPKGVGVLYVRKGASFHPYMTGGHQERALRSGTENTPWIAAIGKAAEVSMRDMDEECARIKAMRDRLEEGLLNAIPDSFINGSREHRVPNTFNISFAAIEGEAILYLLDHVGIEISTGSACSSGSLEPSHVLNAMGISIERMHSSVRISFGKYNTEEDVDYVLEHFPPVIERLRKMSPFVK